MIPIWKIRGRLGNEMFQFAYLYNQQKLGKIKDFYVQDEAYFQESVNEIKKIFSEGIGQIPEVGIHIRRGDYVNNPFYVDLTKTDYYKKAIEMFPRKWFVVISDDIEFATIYLKGLFPDKTFIFSNNTDPVDDLNLFASCSSQIMANSSLSWWGAYLNPNPAKKVIYPKSWYSDGINRTTCPSDWVGL